MTGGYDRIAASLDNHIISIISECYVRRLLISNWHVNSRRTCLGFGHTNSQTRPSRAGLFCLPSWLAWIYAGQGVYAKKKLSLDSRAVLTIQTGRAVGGRLCRSSRPAAGLDAGSAAHGGSPAFPVDPRTGDPPHRSVAARLSVRADFPLVCLGT